MLGARRSVADHSLLRSCNKFDVEYKTERERIGVLLLLISTGFISLAEWTARQDQDRRASFGRQFNGRLLDRNLVEARGQEWVE